MLVVVHKPVEVENSFTRYVDAIRKRNEERYELEQKKKKYASKED